MASDNGLYCQPTDFIQRPSCSVLNMVLFVSLIVFLIMASIVLAFVYYQQYQRTRIHRELSDHLRGRLLTEEDSLLINGPPTRDRYGPDTSRSPSPQRTTLYQHLRHFLRLSDLYRSHDHESFSSSPSSSSSAASQSNPIFMAGDGVNRPILGARLSEEEMRSPPRPVPGNIRNNIKRSIRDRDVQDGRVKVTMGPVRDGSIARRRRSSSELFFMDIDG